jgi:hypothetical protein
VPEVPEVKRRYSEEHVLPRMRPTQYATALVAGVLSAVFFVCIIALVFASCTAASVDRETLDRMVACRDSLARGDTSDVCRALAR